MGRSKPRRLLRFFTRLFQINVAARFNPMGLINAVFFLYSSRDPKKRVLINAFFVAGWIFGGWLLLSADGQS